MLFVTLLPLEVCNFKHLGAKKVFNCLEIAKIDSWKLFVSYSITDTICNGQGLHYAKQLFS